MLNNTTNPVLPMLFQSEPLEMVIPLMICCIIAFVSNLFVCYLILTVRRLKTTTNVFVFSLCICDIMFSAVLLPIHCFYQNSLVYLYMVIITVVIYIGNLTAATYERLYSITKPLQYHLVMTKQRAIKITVVAYLLPLSYCFLPLIWKTDTTMMVHKIYVVGTLIIFLLGPLVFILFVYFKVCLEIKKMYNYNKKLIISNKNLEKNEDELYEKENGNQMMRMFCGCNIKSGSVPKLNRKLSQTLLTNGSIRKIRRATFSDSSEIYSDVKITTKSIDSNENSITKNFEDLTENQSMSSFDRVTKRKSITSLARSFGRRKSSTNKTKIKMAELKASLAFAIVAFTYMFTWLPVVAMTILEAIGKQELTPPTLVVFSIFSIALNALTDPFLYALLLPNFRRTLRKMFRRKKQRF